MKKILFILVISVHIFGMYSCNQNTKTNTNEKEGFYPGTIKAGHLVSLDQSPLFIAKEAGYFKDEGLDVQTVFFSNPGDNNTALAGGSIQFSTNPFTLPYFAENSGIHMRIISSAGGLGIMQVVIQGSFGIEDIRSLVAYVKAHPGTKLKIGLLKGDTLEMIVYKMLNDNGLSYNDFEIVWFNDLLSMVQSFQTKQVDILSHIKPYTTDLVVNYGAKVLTDNSQIWGEGTPNCTVDVMEDFAAKYPGTCEAYLRAIQKGYQLSVDEPEKAADLLIKGNYFKVSKDVLVYAFKTQPAKVILKPNQEGMMIAINDMVKAGYIKQPQVNIVNTTFLDNIEKEKAAK